MDATQREIEVADHVRRILLRALLDAWEDAGIRGLCAEGRFEAAVGALQTLDLRTVLPGLPGGDRGG